MNLVTLGADAVIDLRLSLPRVGAWHADVSVDSVTPATGQVTLHVDGNPFVGTVRRGDVVNQVGTYRLVGGGGGLAKDARAKAYNFATAGVVLGDVLGDAGEKPSPTIDTALTSTSLPFWVTRVAPTAVVLNELCAALGAAVVWRVLPDGTVWLGVDTWPVVKPSTLAVRRMDARLGKADVVLDTAAFIMPGTALLNADAHVSYVQVQMTDATRLVAEVWLE